MASRSPTPAHHEVSACPEASQSPSGAASISMPPSQAAQRSASLPLSIFATDSSPIRRTVQTTNFPKPRGKPERRLMDDIDEDTEEPATKRQKQDEVETSESEPDMIEINGVLCPVREYSTDCDSDESGESPRNFHVRTEIAPTTTSYSVTTPNRARRSPAPSPSSGEASPSQTSDSPTRDPNSFTAIYNDSAPLEEFPSTTTASFPEAPTPVAPNSPQIVRPTNTQPTTTQAMTALTPPQGFHATTDLPGFDYNLATHGTLLSRQKHVFWIYQTTTGFPFFTTRIKSNLNILEALLANANARKAFTVAQGSTGHSADDLWIQVLADEVKLSTLALARVWVAGRVRDGVKQTVLQAVFWEFCGLATQMKALIDKLVRVYRGSEVPDSVAMFVERHSNEAWDLQGVTE